MKYENLCVFYASNAHLAVILKEYLKDKEEYGVVTLFEKGFSEDDEEIAIWQNNLQMKNIDLKSTKKIDAKNIDEDKENIVIIRGTEEYRQKANDYIKEIANKNTKIINCYDFMENRGDVIKIFENSDKILYTTGEKAI